MTTPESKMVRGHQAPDKSILGSRNAPQLTGPANQTCVYCLYLTHSPFETSKWAGVTGGQERKGGGIVIIFGKDRQHLLNQGGRAKMAGAVVRSEEEGLGKDTGMVWSGTAIA